MNMSSIFCSQTLLLSLVFTIPYLDDSAADLLIVPVLGGERCAALKFLLDHGRDRLVSFIRW